MKNKKHIIIAVVAVIIVAAAIMITQPFMWSEKSFEAVVQEMVTQSASVTLKDSFTEETPFYYPIVYEIKVLHTN